MLKPEPLTDTFTIKVDIVSDGKSVVTAVASNYTGVVFIGDEYFDPTIGSAVRDGDDRFDLETGLQLAVGKALRNLGRDILRSGRARVAEADVLKAKEQAAHERDRARREAVRKEWELRLNEQQQPLIADKDQLATVLAAARAEHLSNEIQGRGRKKKNKK